MVITIDGPAGVGKSSVAAYLAREYQLLLLKSGSFYRALSLWVRNELSVLSAAELERAYHQRDSNWQQLWRKAQAADIYQQGEQILLGDREVNAQLQTPQLDVLTPRLSALPPVRHFINGLLRSQAEGRDLIAEGRDMGTVVFPEAEYKFFLDASIRVRAQRRWQQMNALGNLNDLEQQIYHRDEIDRNKPEGALKASENACIIDTSNLTFAAVCQIIADSLNVPNACRLGSFDSYSAKNSGENP